MICAVSPNKPKTPAHSVRVDQDLWDAASAKAAGEGHTIADVIRELLWVYVTGE